MRKSFSNSLWMVLGAGIFSLSFNVWGNDREYLQQIIDAGNRTVTLLAEKFRPHIQPENHDLLMPGRILVATYADFGAFVDYQKRRITIPVALVAENLLQIQGGLLTLRDPQDSALRSKYARWLEYLTKRSHEARVAARKAGPKAPDNIPVQSFWSYAGLPPPRWTDEEERIQQSAMVDAMALIIAHEIGHLALKHRPYQTIGPQQSQQQEHAADKFAVDLLRAADISVLPGLMMTFTRFALNEALYDGLPPGSATHPSADCRFYRIGKMTFDEAFKSAKSRADFERGANMRMEDFKRFLESKKC